MKNRYQVFLLLIFSLTVPDLSPAQSKKALDFDVYEKWNDIQNENISRDGEWVIYTLKPHGGDATLKIHDISKREERTETFRRAEQAQITADSKFVVFHLKPRADSLKAMRRRKVPKDKLPHDSLGIYHLTKDSLIKIPEIQSYQIPEKAGGKWLAYHLEPGTKNFSPQDTAITDTTELVPEEPIEEEQPEPEETEPTEEEIPEITPLEQAQQKVKELEAKLAQIEEEKQKAQAKKNEKPPKPPKKESKENGSKLVLRELGTARQDTFQFVTAYQFDEQGRKLVFSSTGNDSTFLAGVYVYNLENRQLMHVLNAPGKHEKLTWDETGDQLAFIADTDTTKEHKKALIKYYDLYYWQEKNKAANVIASKGATGIPAGWIINQYANLDFSKDGSKLFFGTSPEPLVKDTTLLPEEVVKVNVWNWKDTRLQSQQNVEIEEDRKKSYLAMALPRFKRIVQLATPEVPVVIPGSEGNADVALGLNSEPYLRQTSWAGYPNEIDVYTISLRDGRKRKVKEKLKASVRISPGADYLYWYAPQDSAWYSYSIRTGQTYNLTASVDNRFYDELYDYPDLPDSYGSAGWTENDGSFLVYDRFDIWKIDPENKVAPQRVTQSGRENRIRYRYIQLDPEERFIKTAEPMMLYTFDEETKSSGYFTYQLGQEGAPRKLLYDDYRFGYPTKAKNAKKYIFTRESFVEFPDLFWTDATFTKINRLSRANPQQDNYRWGSVELVKWTNLNGEEMSGLLYKPENFDPGKKYPMVTYFYRRLSDNLHRHYAPLPSRSTIRPSVYTSNGYIVFMSDIPYRIGHPGRSAYEAVVSGVTSLLKEGYIDRDKLGIQGQSWGGYQVAYIVTQTDLFAAAMAGAPVSNMTSAYGGIRWGSGLSRMFQYERSQSRIGATLWEKPSLYIENSPLFYADQIETPLLMMHNDDDGAVPWYQGIELFVALRRLNKPVWMLSYNGEKHNLTQWQNRKDLSIRMRQFFDYYLRFKPEPVWMKEGVPAIEKGIKMRYELTNQEQGIEGSR